LIRALATLPPGPGLFTGAIRRLRDARLAGAGVVGAFALTLALAIALTLALLAGLLAALAGLTAILRLLAALAIGGARLFTFAGAAFFFELAGKFVELALRETQGVRFVAEDRLGRALDARAQFLEVARDVGLEFPSLINETATQQFCACFHLAVGAALPVLAQQIIELAMQPGFGNLGVFGDLAQLLDEFLVLGLLGGDALGDFAALR
jgi:hypothetical protein